MGGLETSFSKSYVAPVVGARAQPERLEVLLVDDSPGASWAAAEYAASLGGALAGGRVRYLSNGGRARAKLGSKRNAAVEAARGDVVVVWDDDDFYAPARLKTQVRRIARGADVVMLGDDDELCVEGSAEWERNSGGWGSVGVEEPVPPPKERLLEDSAQPVQMFYCDAQSSSFSAVSGSSFAQPCSMAFRRSLFAKGARYAAIDACEDLAFLDAVLERRAKVATTRVPWVRVRHGANVVVDAQGDGHARGVTAESVLATGALADDALRFLRSLRPPGTQEVAS